VTFLQELLAYYDLKETDYHFLTRQLTVADLFIDQRFDDLNKIVSTINTSIANKEKIFVYGDYDADGVLATSILVSTFAKLNYPIGYYIPNRYNDGYGLNINRLKEIIAKGYKLLITVDNGISAHEAIDYAYRHGVKVIVTDHHQCDKDLPPCEGILHPLYKTNNPQNMCGAAMSLALSKALINTYDRYFIALAAMATIADVMPLTGNNRDLVRLGIQYLNEDRYPSILHLNEDNLLNELSLAMNVIPSINAIGRMIEDQRINRLVGYFTHQKHQGHKLLASWIKQINIIRKNITKEAINNISPLITENNPIIILSEEKEGMVGLLASRLVNEFNQPTIIFTHDSNDENLLVGSARTPEGHDLIKIFDQLKEYIIKAGGHANAGGLTIKRSDFELFKSKAISYFLDNVTIIKPQKYIDILPDDINIDNYHILRTFAPFGQQFPQPLLRINQFPTHHLQFIKDGKYLSTQLNKGKLFSFTIGKNDIPDKPYINIIGNMQLNVFRGLEQVNMIVNSVAYE
jgi:single-stranded-DNA-specific exonuclease